ncbi:MAG: methyltransferase domain-containing protein [Anaerolineae bacterium]|nr:methyltransferase domain-containing protein [Anaerolineae bacterium]
MPRPPDALTALYRLTAPQYEPVIAHVLRHFAADLVRQATLYPDDLALDIGTGTGVLARELAGRVRFTVGVDLTLPMLRTAHALRPARSAFVQMDANRLTGLTAASCDVAFASFGLADCHPGRALRTIARVLRPGGRFYVQEWGPGDGESDPRSLVDEALAEHAVPTTNVLHEAIRTYVSAVQPWQMQLQDCEDYADHLAAAGFARIRVEEARPVTVRFQPGAERFLTYALAWSPRALEFDAMSEEARHACQNDALRRLRALEAPDGALLWRPRVFRVSCVRKL